MVAPVASLAADGTVCVRADHRADPPHPHPHQPPFAIGWLVLDLIKSHLILFHPENDAAVCDDETCLEGAFDPSEEPFEKEVSCLGAPGTGGTCCRASCFQNLQPEREPHLR